MGKINFLSDNQGSGNNVDSYDNKSAASGSEIKWTSPDEIALANNEKEPSKDGLDSTRRVKNRFSSITGADKEQLAVDNSFSVKKNELKVALDQPNNSKIFGFLNKIFSSKKLTNKDLANSKFKNNKEIIADYGDAVNDEKKIRKNYNNISDRENNNVHENAQEKSFQSELSDNNRWKAPKILKTDLIKDEVTIFIDWKKNINNILINSALAVVIIIIAYFGLGLWGKSSAEQVKTLDNEIANLAQKIIKSNEEIKKIDDFQKELSLAGKIIDQHIYWTNFFNFLEKNTLPEVSYSGGFKGDTVGNYNFSVAAPNITSLVDQIRVFKADTANVLTVDVSKAVLSGGTENAQSENKTSGSISIESSLMLTVDPKIFLK
jgi:hypothetical protein